MTDDRRKATRSFRLLSEKPRVVIFNTADDEQHPERFTALATADMPVIAIPAGLELELFKMTPEDRAEFQREMGVGGADRDGLICTLFEDLWPAAFSHRRREGSAHLDLAPGRDGPGRRGLDPHRSGPRLHPRRDHDLQRLGAAGERARGEGPSSGAAGAQGLRHSGRRHPADPLQRVRGGDFLPRSSPVGTTENSPAIHCWVTGRRKSLCSPGGTTEPSPYLHT